jgi:hypothetical protein
MVLAVYLVFFVVENAEGIGLIWLKQTAELEKAASAHADISFRI